MSIWPQVVTEPAKDGGFLACHASAVDAARVANDVGAHVLVLYHLVPALTSFVAERAFVQGVDDARADNVVLARDGILCTLPPHSDVVEESWIND